jgi:hypothetical protein
VHDWATIAETFGKKENRENQQGGLGDGLEWALKMRQPVKAQNLLNGESHEFVSKEVHPGV